MAKKDVKSKLNKNISKIKQTQVKKLNLSKQTKITAPQTPLSVNQQTRIKAPKTSVSFTRAQTKSKAPKTPVSVTNPQTQIHYWGIFLYAALILIILLGVLMLVKYGDVVVGKATQITLDQNNMLTNVEPNSENTFLYNGVWYKLIVGSYDTTTQQLSVSLEVCVDCMNPLLSQFTGSGTGSGSGNGNINDAK